LNVGVDHELLLGKMRLYVGMEGHLRRSWARRRCKTRKDGFWWQQHRLEALLFLRLSAGEGDLREVLRWRQLVGCAISLSHNLLDVLHVDACLGIKQCIMGN
jgi:hypothetical protein